MNSKKTAKTMNSSSTLYDANIEQLINCALIDGKLTDKEKQILFKKAQAQGIDLDEFEMVLDARLVELEKTRKEESPKSNKHGDVRKCPNCGASVPPLVVVCPECKVEFSGVEANLSSKKLANLLLKAKNISKKEEIIITFPIPNTKEDLFEFLSSLQPRIRDTKDPLSKAYFKKYHECINKAKLSFVDDPVFQPYFTSFKKEKRQIKITTLRESRKLWLSIIGVLIVISFFLFRFVDYRKHKVATNNIEKSILMGDEKNVLKAVTNSPDFEYPIELLTKLVNEGYLDVAIYFYNNKTSHCSTYKMKRKNKRALFTREATQLIYDALICSERMEEAWLYHPLGDEDPNSEYNCSSYYEYMCDVIDYYCKNGKKEMARQFVKEHLIWYRKNEGPYDSKYDYYSSYSVNARLMNQIDNY